MKPNEIKLGLNTNIFGKEIIYFSETTSTNDIAIEFAREGAEQGTLIIADKQTMGKGRRGRKWLAPSKTCILASIILRPSISLEHVNIITPIAVTSVTKAINCVTQLNASVKWPNDVLIGEKKVSGILTETRTLKSNIDFAVVGIGVNVNIPKDEIPLEICQIATSLNIELGYEISRTQLLQEILRQFEDRYLRLNENNYEEFLAEWKSLSSTIGKKVQIESKNDIKFGVVLDIDKSGDLIVRLDDGEILKINNDDLMTVRNI